jgi:hypothetical protein
MLIDLDEEVLVAQPLIAIPSFFVTIEPAT